MKQLTKRLQQIGDYSTVKSLPHDQMQHLLHELNYSLDQCSVELDQCFEQCSKTGTTMIYQQNSKHPKRSQSQKPITQVPNPYSLLNPNKARLLKSQCGKQLPYIPQIIESRKTTINTGTDRQSSNLEPSTCTKKSHKPKRGANYTPKFIVPKEIRTNPFAKRNIIDDNYLKKGCNQQEYRYLPCICTQCIVSQSPELWQCINE